MVFEAKSIEYTSIEKKCISAEECLQPKIRAIINLDFFKQKEKFVVDPDIYGWTRSSVDAAEILYKNFLYLCLVHGDDLIVPNISIDEFWHGHILDTSRYREDCQRIFGELLHHNPYFGYGSPIEEKKLEDAFDHTQDLHKKEFGEILYEVCELPD